MRNIYYQTLNVKCQIEKSLPLVFGIELGIDLCFMNG